MTQSVAVIVGVGPGLGWSLAKCFSAAGMKVALAARHKEKIEALVREHDLSDAHTYVCDSTDATAVRTLFLRVADDLGEPSVVVFNAGAFEPGKIVDIDPADFERCWKVGCLGGFLVGQMAARSMLAGSGGTILFTGATAARRGSAGYANLAVPKFGLRALAQSMARELGPQNIHVAHIVIDGQIDSPQHANEPDTRPPDSLLSPDAIADTFLQLHRQPRNAWTLELDLRPWVESF